MTSSIKCAEDVLELLSPFPSLFLYVIMVYLETISESRPITNNKLENKWTEAINQSGVANALISNTSQRPIRREGTASRILSLAMYGNSKIHSPAAVPPVKDCRVRCRGCVDLRAVLVTVETRNNLSHCHCTEICSSQLLRKSGDGHTAMNAELYQYQLCSW